jgi:hypothetical protein
MTDDSYWKIDPNLKQGISIGLMPTVDQDKIPPGYTMAENPPIIDRYKTSTLVKKIIALNLS